MPFTPDSPNMGDIPQPTVPQSLNKVHILGIDIQLTPGDAVNTALEVRWAEGYEDNGEFIPVKKHKERFHGRPGGKTMTPSSQLLARSQLAVRSTEKSKPPCGSSFRPRGFWVQAAFPRRKGEQVCVA